MSTPPPIQSSEPSGLASAQVPGVAPVHSFAPFRLRRHADYGPVYAASRKYSSPSIAYFFRVRADVGSGVSADVQIALPAAPTPRIGLTCPRALGNAVVRNRIKRRMREALRLHLAPLVAPGLPPVDLVLHPRRSVADMPFLALTAEVAELLHRVARMAPRGPEPPRPRPAGDRKPGKGKPAPKPVSKPAPKPASSPAAKPIPSPAASPPPKAPQP